MGYLMDILIGIVSGLLTGELRAHAERLAKWIIRTAVNRLPSDERERFREEWLAHLGETTGTLRKIWHAIGCYLGAAKIANIRLRHCEGIAGPDKIRAFLESMQKEWLVLDESGLDEPDMRDALVKRMAIKLEELEFTKDEAEYVAGLLLIAKKMVTAVPSPSCRSKLPKPSRRRQGHHRSR
jgi:hypothetical protein